jgi:hypothetical protein
VSIGFRLTAGFFEKIGLLVRPTCSGFIDRTSKAPGSMGEHNMLRLRSVISMRRWHFTASAWLKPTVRAFFVAVDMNERRYPGIVQATGPVRRKSA